MKDGMSFSDWVIIEIQRWTEPDPQPIIHSEPAISTSGYVTPTPEPGVWAFLAIGVLAVVIVKRWIGK